MVIEQSMSSKSGTIRSLLIRAWRERWTDLQWGIHIKTVLPRYISGDIYHLSDYILQQALMGPLPNNLILSYLRHSLYSQIVSYGGVLESIAKYDGLKKPHCILALLNLLQSMMKSISCKGKPEDCLMLALSLVGVSKWLVQVMSWSTQQLIDLRTAPEHSNNLNLAGSILLEMVNSPFLTCMLDIGRWEDKILWNECIKKMTEVETLLSGAGGVIENKEVLINTICEVRDSNPMSSLQTVVPYDCTKTPLSYALHSIIMVEVNMHPVRDIAKFAQQLLLLQKLKGMSLTELFIELLHCCFLGLSCPEHLAQQEMKWVGFTFIKVPNLIGIIHSMQHGDSTPGPSEELLAAVKEISTMTALLDMADSRLNCNCLEYLLYEFGTRKKLLIERDAQVILALRNKESTVLPTLQKAEGHPGSPGNPNLVLRALGTGEGILNDLNTKPPDAVLPVMVRVISGRSRELLLTAVAASGNLHVFAQRIISLNEQSLEPQPSETTQMAKNRALMFDYTFLLLCYIAQVYGIHTVVSDKCDTFIEQWLRDTLPEVGRTKNPFSNCNVDEAAIEEFIRQLNNIDSDSKYSNARWSEVCQVATIAFKEVVKAAYHGHVSTEFVNNLLDRLCHYLCCLPITVSAWLCSHIQMADSQQAEKAYSCLKHLQSKMSAQDNPVGLLDSYKDRSVCMFSVIQDMIQVLKGDETTQSLQNSCLSPNVDVGSNNSNTMPAIGIVPMECDSQLLLSQMLEELWQDVSCKSGLLTHKSLATCRQLLRLGGTRSYVNSLVKVAMDNVFLNELTKSIDIIYGLFHLDICDCTFNLLIYTLPLYISGPAAGELMCERRIEVLAKLTMMMIVSAWMSVQPSSTMETTSGVIPQMIRTPSRKRPYYSRELEDLESKLVAQASELNLDASCSNLGWEGTSLLVAVHSLFKIMTQVSRSGVVSPVTHLIVAILHELVATPNTHTLLKLLPSTLLSNIIPLLTSPSSFSYPQLLALSAPRPADATIESTTDMHSIQQEGQSASSGRAAAKLLCVSRNLELNASLE